MSNQINTEIYFNNLIKTETEYQPGGHLAADLQRQRTSLGTLECTGWQLWLGFDEEFPQEWDQFRVKSRLCDTQSQPRDGWPDVTIYYPGSHQQRLQHTSAQNQRPEHNQAITI